ncbi:ABC transporter ATP-binding protein [Virgibacillus byunsanensis]|uniref:ABC transporter ATP-binding protein n=1 Tax=Virgibacillus byunsanensis TaxID=570945 RepID=A0ABW3LF57_9BACI
MLSIKNVNTYYGNIQALKDVSIKVPEGEIVSILGSNGAGKTTTMKTITGMLKPKSGNVTFLDEDVTFLEPHQLVEKGIALVPEGREILGGMSVLENLEMGAFHRKDKEVKNDIEKVMDRFPILRERKNQLGGTLSGGQQQMLAIARALMSKPKLLLLDEPSMGLAPLVVQDIFRIIREINKEGTTVLLVEQNARQALKVAHTAYVLETGKVVKSGLTSEMINDSSIKEAYLGH